MADADTVTIRSTTDPADGTAACLLTWGPVEALLTPATTLATARDLMAAAAHAEADIAVLGWCTETLRTDEQTAGQILLDIRGRRPAPLKPAALRIQAVAGYNTRQPYVHISRGSRKAPLSPDEARQMAVQWTQAATAAQIDVRLRYALGEWDHLSSEEIDRLFLTVQRLGR